MGRAHAPWPATSGPTRRCNPAQRQTIPSTARGRRSRTRSASDPFLFLGVTRTRSRSGGSRSIPDLLDEPLVPLHAALNDDVDQPPQQRADVTVRQLSATFTLLDEQHQL